MHTLVERLVSCAVVSLYATWYSGPSIDFVCMGMVQCRLVRGQRHVTSALHISPPGTLAAENPQAGAYIMLVEALCGHIEGRVTLHVVAADMTRAYMSTDLCAQARTPWLPLRQ